MASQSSPPDLDEKLSLVAKTIPNVAGETAADAKDVTGFVQIEVAKKQAELRNEWLLIGLREKYGRNIIMFLWVYFVLAATMMIASAAHLFGFVLPENVQIALVGGTAVSVIGVVGTVAAGLFKPPQR